MFDLTDKYEVINSDNIKSIIIEANRQIRLLFEDESLSGFYIVNWRVNFWNAHEYVSNIKNRIIDEEEKYFLKSFDKSASVLYRRLEIDY